MRRFTRFLPVLWISATIVATGCTNRAPSLRMLDTRAGYNNPYDDEEVAIYQRARAEGDTIGRPIGPRVAYAWVYPHDLPSQDRFMGGYVALIIHRDEVVFDNPDSESPDLSDETPKKKSAPKIHPVKSVRAR